MKKRKIVLIIFLVFNVNTFIFSQTDILEAQSETEVSSDPETQVDNSLKKILGTIVTITGSVYVKALATVSLIYIALKLIISGDKREFFKKVYGWILACFLVVLVPAILEKALSISDSISSLQTFSLFNTPSYSDSTKKSSKSSK